eukprot:5757992-Prymnesium_polylepis.2
MHPTVVLLCVSWFPGRGQRIGDPSIGRLLSADHSVLLIARRQPSCKYVLCGRLRAVALGVPQDTEEGDPALDGVPVWPTCAAEGMHQPAPHVVWELLDAPKFLTSRAAVEELF